MIKDVRFHTVHPNALNGSGHSLKSIYFKNCSFTNTLNLKWEEAVSLEYLKLESLDIGQLNISSFKGLWKIDELYLKGINTTTIEKGAFQDLKYLKYLSLIECSLGSVTWLKSFRSLLKLHIYISSFSRVTYDTFIPATSIEKLYIRNSSLRSVVPLKRSMTAVMDPAGAGGTRTNACCKNDIHSSQYNDMTEFDLDWNEIKISSGDFQSFSSLKKLSLRYNGIIYLPVDSFVGLSNLEILFLNYNNISLLPQGLFRRTQNIKTLSIASNSIQSLEAVCKFSIIEHLNFNDSASVNNSSELSNLLFLDAQRNNITLISNNSFQKCTNLETLYLSHNHVNCIEERAFRHLKRIRILELANNVITSLPLNTFNNLTRLRILRIHSNSIPHLKKGIFDTLDNLKGLYANKNVISSIEIGAFMPLTRLMYLYLNDNVIRILQSNLFAGLSSLIQLKLNNNQIMILPRKVFHPLHSLQELYLNYNNIRHITPGTFHPLHSLRRLNLENNQLRTLTTEMVTVPLYLYFYNNPLMCNCDLFWVNNINGSAGPRFQRTHCTNQSNISIFSYLEQYCCGSREGACPSFKDPDPNTRHRIKDINVIIGLSAALIIGGFIVVVLICVKKAQPCWRSVDVVE